MSNTTARDAFAALGLTETDWTPAMRLAVKQKWTNLPVDEKVSVLRERLQAVSAESTADAQTLHNAGFGTEEECAAEAARLKRNAGVQAWRARNQIQAALDAREAKFAKMRAGRALKAVS